MSLVQLRVELPTYAHSFTLQVANSSTVLEVKQEISKSCIGSPRVEGQRIIWRGRYLADDEKLEALWKSPDEPRIIHLSVHPSAWKSSPPNVTQKAHQSAPSVPMNSAPSNNRSTSQIPHPVQSIASTLPPTVTVTATPTTTTPSSPPQSLAYVLAKHRKSLSVLTQGIPVRDDITAESEQSRAAAVQFIERHGYSWPTILDQAFPPFEQGGLKYERKVIEGRPYLSLQNPSEKPTAAQLHALNVLSYTLTLLKLPREPPPAQPATHSQQVPAHLNALLQQMGLPPIQALPVLPPANQRNVVVERGIPIRPFLFPLIMLLFRTLILLYFVAPARKPVFGILLLAWVLYEIWPPMRIVFVRRAAQPNQQGHAAAAQGAAPNGEQVNGAANGPQARAVPRPDTAAQAGAALDPFANIDVEEEEAALAGQVAQEPSLGRKIMTFVALFLTTVHPAVWNRRRRVLRQREGRIRTEASTRESQDEGDDAAQNARRAEARAELLARHANRPRWIQDYIHRVVHGEWVDDSD